MGIREDEFVCEDAVAHLQSCCPGFTGSNVDCTYQSQGGCGSPPIYPEISTDQASCIRNKSCDQLRAGGDCARAIAMPAGAVWAEGASDGPNLVELPFPQVCQ
jgi:hypothetical protein